MARNVSSRDADAEDAAAINFWPAFSDFMLAIVLVLILVIALVLSTRIDVADVTSKQQRLSESSAFVRQGMTLHRLENEVVQWHRDGSPAITFTTDRNNPFLQNITFSDWVLFDSDSIEIVSGGQEILRIVGEGIRARVGDIEQIQIHGHADVRPTRRYVDNLELASRRANSVFRFLQAVVGIDPVQQVMSSVSFAEYVPMDRQHGKPFTWEQLRAANGEGVEEAKMRRNRRIEMLLFYRREAG